MASPFTLPSWYKISTPSTEAPRSAELRGDMRDYATVSDSMSNALLPYISTADQRTAASKLATTSPAYSTYNTATYDKEPARVTSDIRRKYLSSDRANQILSSLDNMKTTAGYTDEQLGPGYKYLLDVVNTLKRLGGTGSGGMTRAQFQEFNQTVSSLTDAYESDNRTADTVAPYSTLARYISSPTFSGGTISNTRKVGTRTLAGTANSRLF